MSRRASGLILPEVVVPGLDVVLHLSNPRKSNYLRRLELNDPAGPLAGGEWPELFAGQKSQYLKQKILDHEVGKTSFTMPATVALALTTVAPGDTSTGASITEATYTGYARLTLAGSTFAAATAASPSETHNSAQQTFAACTSGSSTIIGWALCDSASTGAGNILFWGTCTSTVISTTQTPPTIAASGLSITES